MTGNKNTWRAPLAGLASLAMIATMGVAAGTASADDFTPAPPVDDVTVTLNANYGKFSDGTATKSVKDSSDGATLDGKISDLYTKYKPTRAGYEFTGWYTTTGEGSAVAPDATVTEGETLYAHWTTSNKTDGAKGFPGIVFNVPNGLSAVNYSTSAGDVVKADGNDVKVLLAKTDRLASWQVPSDKAGDGVLLEGFRSSTSVETPDFDVDTATAPATYYAKFSDNAKTVTFDYSGIGSGARADDYSETVVDVAKGSKVAAPVVYFDRAADSGVKIVTTWKYGKNPQQVWDFANDTVNDSIRLVASRDDNAAGYLVYTFWRAEDNKTVLAVKKGSSLNDEIKSGHLTAPTRYGYTFEGWTDLLTGKAADLFNGITESGMIGANWKQVKAIELKITYDLNYDGAPAPTTVTYGEGELVEKPADPVREGYEFTGWTVNVNYDNADYWQSRLLNHTLFSSYVDKGGSLTLYASWKPVTNKQAFVAAYNFPQVKLYDQTNGGDAKYFTPESWKAYVAKFKDVAKAVGNDPASADEATATKLLAQLKDARKELVFAKQTNVWRIKQVSTKKHLYTSSTAEAKSALDNGWVLESDDAWSVPDTSVLSWGAYRRAVESGFFKTIYRLRQRVTPSTSRYLYADAEEIKAMDLLNKGWTYETATLTVQVDAKTPVYRAYSPSRYEHLYTTSAQEYKNVTTLPSSAEGWYRADNNGKGVFFVNE